MLNFFIIYFIALLFIILLIGYTVLRSKIKSPLPLIIIISILIILPLIGGYSYLVYFSNLPEVEVPNLRNMSVEQASGILKSIGLHYRANQETYDSNITPGRIVSIFPEAGQIVKEGRTITLTVSQGKHMTIVPDLIGKNINEINDILNASNLSLGQQNIIYNESQPEQTVVIQSPLAGDTVEVGASIEVTITMKSN